MQIVAYGAQDIYLTGDPMITHFKTVYRRHTNFAMEYVEQQFNCDVDFGSSVSVLISRTGDLLSNVYLETTLPQLNGLTNVHWTQNVGHHLLKQVDVEIGNQLIDRHYGDWLDIWAQLSTQASLKLGYYEMIGQGRPDAFNRQSGLQKANNLILKGSTIFVPLQFWFCRNIALALPLISLQFHEVKINFTFSNLTDLLRSPAEYNFNIRLYKLSNTKLWVNYVYLDLEERRKFAHSSHEYLIDQVQCTSAIKIANESRKSTSTTRINLNFNHPVKELIWTVQPVSYTLKYNRQNSNYTSVSSQSAVTFSALNNVKFSDDIKKFNSSCISPPGALNPVVNALLTLNGHDRFQTLSGDYFSKIQPLNHHTCVPESPGINVYSFSINPESHEPSGTCNFSRIDNAYLTLTIATLQSNLFDKEYPEVVKNSILYAGSECIVKVYAVNYNILRIMNGLGGLAYSN
jgi:hypothetical protein